MFVCKVEIRHGMSVANKVPLSPTGSDHSKSSESPHQPHHAQQKMLKRLETAQADNEESLARVASLEQSIHGVPTLQESASRSPEQGGTSDSVGFDAHEGQELMEPIQSSDSCNPRSSPPVIVGEILQ